MALADPIRRRILHFRPEPLSEVQQWITSQQAFWANRLQAIDDLLTAEDAATEIPLPRRKRMSRKIESKTAHEFKASADPVKRRHSLAAPESGGIGCISGRVERRGA